MGDHFMDIPEKMPMLMDIFRMVFSYGRISDGIGAICVIANRA